jgi:hypothetical protein
MQYILTQDQPQRQKAIDRFKLLLDQEATVELKKVIGRRTLSQNAFLHVLITLYGINFGLKIEEAKVLLKRECPFMRYTKQIGEDREPVVFLKQTRDLDKRELGEFIEWIYTHAAQQMCPLPELEDYKANKPTFDAVIRSHRAYL